MVKKLSRRHFLRFVGVGTGFLALSACATPTPQPSQKAPVSPTETAAVATSAKGRTKITYWGSFSGNLGEAEKAVVKQFNEAQSDVELDYQFQGSYEETAQKLTAALSAGTAPTVSLLSDVWWFKFYLAQAIIPLNDLMAAERIDPKDYVDPLINEGVRKGQVYWLPFARSTPIFYYNKDVWAEAGLPDRGPETWDEFVSWAPKLIKKEGDKVVRSAFAHPGSASYIAWIFQCVVWQFEGRYSDPDFTIRIDEPNALEAAAFYRASTQTEKWATTPKDIGVDFINGFTASVIGSTAGLANFEKNAKFKVGTAFLPKKKQFGCCTGGSGMAILKSASDADRRAGMKWIGFATGTEGTIFWSQNTGYMPVRKSAIDSPKMKEFYKERPNFLTAVNQLPKTQPQDTARVFIPNGDQIIGKGMERFVIAGEDHVAAFKDVAATLRQEAKPVVESLRKLEG